MKNAVGTATNSGNVNVAQGEKTRISPAAYGVLMDLLSNIYSDSAAAVLREYSVNGWDEHQKHGVKRPVEVTLPSTLQPTLVIRDFGKGLPLEGEFHLDAHGDKVWDVYGVMQVFGEYGESSKRDNNDEVGGFGIGSKAAFALGHQFMVTSYKDGETFTALFTINEDGTGTKNIISEGKTTQPNGVEISLGVDNVEAMNETAERFFSFWNRGDVLVNGEEPTPIFERLERITDEIYLDSEGRGEAYAVMGPVAYPVDRALLRKVSAYLEKSDLGEAAGLPLRLIDSGTDVYLRVPIGSVKPAPNREMLRDKESTIHTLGSIFLAIHQESAGKIQSEVDAAPSFYAAAKALHDGNENLGAFRVNRKTILWNGQRILKQAPVAMTNYQLVTRSWRSTTKIIGQESTAHAEFPEVEGWLVVTGVSEDNEGAVRRYSKRFLEENEIGVTRVFVTETDAVSFGWFQIGVESGARTVTLDEWRGLVRKMRKASPRTVNEPSYTTGFDTASRDLEDRDLLSDIIGEGKDIVIFNDSATWLNRFQREVLKDYTVIVLLGTQSEDALRKRIEQDGSVSVVEWADLAPKAVAAAQVIVDSFTDTEKEAVGAAQWLRENRGTRTEVANLIKALSRVGEVTSPTLLGVEDSFLLAEEFAAPLAEGRVQEIAAAMAGVNGTRYHSDVTGVAYEDEIPALSERYPLLDVSDVVRANRLMENNVVLHEDGTVEFTGNSWSYSRERYERDLTLLQHALAYVNSH